MTPEASVYLRKARDQLRQAEVMMSAALEEAAGRAAYIAGFHAAQAFLFETTGKVFKTHSGTRGEFGRLTKDDPRFGVDLRAFLGRLYELKSNADYGTDPDLKITREQAAEAIVSARLFVGRVAGVLGDTGG